MNKERIAWLDMAKGIGIFLVAYVHMSQWFDKLDFTASQYQVKFICSFIIQFFFFISGFMYKYNDTLSKTGQIKKLISSRLLPVLFFNVINALIELVISNLTGTFDLKIFALKFLFLFIGIPTFNNVTWFLICLFFIEVIQLLIWKKIKEIWKILIIILLFFAGGFYLSEHVIGILYIPRLILVPYGFYLSGYLFRMLYNSYADVDFSAAKIKLLFLSCSLIMFALVYLTYDLNNISLTKVVTMFASLYGNPGYFLLTSFAGTIMLIFLSLALPQIKSLLYLGVFSLTFFCLNGIEYHFTNLAVINAIKPFVDIDNNFQILLSSTILTAISLLVLWPFNYILNKYFPVLVGKSVSV
ncbi:MAG: acyltransferase family protein [Spirochaetes bacterium]|jgi:fucose 4-O-acetylase-like acetyltransferase|nr:acyltransferase family protein [Spirochaetota bacterium]